MVVLPTFYGTIGVRFSCIVQIMVSLVYQAKYLNVNEEYRVRVPKTHNGLWCKGSTSEFGSDG